MSLLYFRKHESRIWSWWMDFFWDCSSCFFFGWYRSSKNTIPSVEKFLPYNACGREISLYCSRILMKLSWRTQLGISKTEEIFLSGHHLFSINVLKFPVKVNTNHFKILDRTVNMFLWSYFWWTHYLKPPLNFAGSMEFPYFLNYKCIITTLRCLMAKIQNPKKKACGSYALVHKPPCTYGSHEGCLSE